MTERQVCEKNPWLKKGDQGSFPPISVQDIYNF